MRVLCRRVLAVLAVCAAICAFTAVASASNIDFVIHWDPTPVTPNMLGPLYEITSTSAVYQVSWQPCKNYSGALNPLPTGDACLGFYNDSGAPLTQFSISFTVPNTTPASPLVGQSITCTPDDGYLTTRNCSAAGKLEPGQTVDLTFSGGTPITPNLGFWFSETSACGDGTGDCLPVADVTAAAEPGTLVLSGIALLGLAAFGLRRIRASSLT